MPRLFEGFDAEEAEGIPVQWAACYLLNGREHPELPRMVFRESPYTTEMFDELLAAIEELVAIAEDVIDGHYELDLFNLNPAKAAIARAKGEDANT